MRNELKVLLQSPEVQRRVIAVLETMGLVIPGAKSFGAIEIVKHMGDDIVTDTDVNKLRALFPPGKRNNTALIKQKMIRFMQAHEDVTVDQVLRSAYLWVNAKGDYCGEAKYFFYKKTVDGEESRCEEFLEYAKPQPDDLI